MSLLKSKTVSARRAPNGVGLGRQTFVVAKTNLSQGGLGAPEVRNASPEESMDVR